MSSKVQAIRARREYRVGDKHRGIPITEIAMVSGLWFVKCRASDGSLHDVVTLNSDHWEEVPREGEEK